ncbi:MAG: SPOUT family RNA methylase [Nitrososphaerota archaeon]|nr:SPOUT family RNA methylase [Candidatus Calditenuaceae archaeon]MDW8073918.1 SPOUT family RNA methylase [Nitrososphaerota archaeon]
MEVLVKTPLGLEEVCAARISELDPGAEIVVKPGGYVGLVAVTSCGDPEALYARIFSEVLEAESVYRVKTSVPASLEDIAEAAVQVARGQVDSSKSFAVRTVRRGRHSFTSLDVNIAVGAAIQRELSSPVDLDTPDMVVRVEIIGEKAYIAVYEGSREWVKMRPGKREAHEFFAKISVVQMPYTGPPKSCREIGARIGRAVQAFEVGELVVAPSEPVDARSLSEFLQGVLEGQASRLEVQQRAYGRRPRIVSVVVQDLYQLVRARRGEPIIVFEPEGVELSKTTQRLAELYSSARRINLLFGAREGIPKGVYRAADLVIDLAPAMTLPTELAAPTALLATYTAYRMTSIEGVEPEEA